MKLLIIILFLSVSCGKSAIDNQANQDKGIVASAVGLSIMETCNANCKTKLRDCIEVASKAVVDSEAQKVRCELIDKDCNNHCTECEKVYWQKDYFTDTTPMDEVCTGGTRTSPISCYYTSPSVKVSCGDY